APLRRLAPRSPCLTFRPPPSPAPLALQVEGERPVLPAEREPDPSVECPRRCLESLAEILRIVSLLEDQLPALLGRKLLELVLVLLDERQELRRQPVFQFPYRHGLELSHVAAP